MKQKYKEDKYLINQLIARKPEAIIEIRQKYGKLIYSTAKKILKSEDWAMDIRQEVFASLLMARPKKIDNLSAYLITITRNRAFKEIKDQSKLITAIRKRAQENGPDYYIVESDEDVSNYYEIVMKAVDQLSVTQKSVLNKKADNKTMEEIAKELDMEVSTANTHLARARKRIREYVFKETGLTIMFF